MEISAQFLYKAVYEACFKANTCLSLDVYNSLKNLEKLGEDSSDKMSKIFLNNSIANTNERPLCQDTGQVVVFLEIGENVYLNDENPISIVNKAVADCYKDNYFRKSVVKDAFFERINTQDNTPAIVYVDYIKENIIKANVLIKGGGAENMSSVKMLMPSASEEDIFDYVLAVVENAGENACPPLFLGVGIGGTIDYAGVLSKKAFFTNLNEDFSQRLQTYINKNSKTKVAKINTLTSSTHIASLPVCITVNCHSTRHAQAIINNDGYEIITKFVSDNVQVVDENNLLEINTEEIEKLKKLDCSQEILLTGTIYTARDMAHKILVEMIEKDEDMPFELKNSIIFYAGPCPKKKNEIIGPVGPTTSKRMDKFAPLLYEKGVLATIGKGERSKEVVESINENNSLYFSIQGGVASLLQSCIKSVKVVAFEEFGAEAIYKLEVEKLPIRLELK